MKPHFRLRLEQGGDPVRILSISCEQPQYRFKFERGQLFIDILLTRYAPDTDKQVDEAFQKAIKGFGLAVEAGAGLVPSYTTAGLCKVSKSL